MGTIEALLAVLTPEQRAQLVAQLTPESPLAVGAAVDAAPASSYYDMSAAVPATFKATLSATPKARNAHYSDRYDHLWCKGHVNVRGPKGGVYFVGRGVMGVKKGQQTKGILRVSALRFEDLRQGGTIDAWFRVDGEKDSTLIGALSQYRAV